MNCQALTGKGGQQQEPSQSIQSWFDQGILFLQGGEDVKNHLDALLLRLDNEKQRLKNAKTQAEKDLRTVWIKQIEKEIDDEFKHLGKVREPLPTLTDDELLVELLKD